MAVGGPATDSDRVLAHVYGRRGRFGLAADEARAFWARNEGVTGSVGQRVGEKGQVLVSSDFNRAKGLEVVFNAYDVGPYASGPYEVDIPYDRLKPILRADGPISR